MPLTYERVIVGADEVGDGRIVVPTAGTAVQLPSQACRWVIITAEEDNANAVCVGGSTVVAALATRRGKPLYQAQSYRFDVANLDKLYVDAITNGEGVTYIWGK